MSKKEARDFLKEDFNVTLHEKMVYRALRLARERLVGSEKEQYGKLRGNLFEFLLSNPRSTTLLRPILEDNYSRQLLKMLIINFFVIAYGVDRSETYEAQTLLKVTVSACRTLYGHDAHRHLPNTRVRRVHKCLVQKKTRKHTGHDPDTG
ncbi:hypothetical protein PIB30_082111 [Stylosanthes scabra]|uniref:Uncharacterized protein n=1 Tax=Stylosanthes scabra TaxID=79078 RepID=A0ABU6TRG2_9FABA|nr:hypothetical protein [Stylosanthes scabra]